jgi:hypothetical protein
MYLAACKFLICSTQEVVSSDSTCSLSDSQISTIETYKPVLDLKMISLEDRVALACSYLSDKDLIIYLKSQLLQCLKDGDYEGLIITGLGNPASLELLQRCIDVRQDIQTAALLVCRTIESAPSGSATHGTQETIWLYEYRQLLNRWCIIFLSSIFLFKFYGTNYIFTGKCLWNELLLTSIWAKDTGVYLAESKLH